MLIKLICKLFLSIFVLPLFLLLFPQSTFPREIKNKETAYIELIQIYKEWLSLDSETFKMLSFKLSSEQLIRKGSSLKLTLEDNLGRKWIFKPDYMGTKELKYEGHYANGEAAVIVYKIYKLFGLETPRIHFITLNINGKEISGSIQRFVLNKGTLSNHRPLNISSNGLNYVLDAHTLDWLLRNHHATDSHFLVLSLDETGKPEELMRVDNEINLTLPNKNISTSPCLSMNWPCPASKRHSRIYYYLWESYLFEEINLDFKKHFAFIEFVSRFPDDFFTGLMLSEKTHNIEDAGQSKLEKMKKDHKNLLDPIHFRKLNLIKDFKKFYKNLAKKRGDCFEIPQDINCRKIINSVSNNLFYEIKKLKEEKLKLKKAPDYSFNIDAVFSLKGFHCLKKAYRVHGGHKAGNLTFVCDTALKNLLLLKPAAKNKYEKKALEIYIYEVKKIRSGKAPSFPYSGINKVIKTVMPEK